MEQINRPADPYKVNTGTFYDPTNTIGEDIEVAKCLCGNPWFERVEVARYKRDQLVNVGQKLQPISHEKFYLLRCPKCQETFEPDIQLGTTGKLKQLYDRFVEIMQTPLKLKHKGETL